MDTSKILCKFKTKSSLLPVFVWMKNSYNDTTMPFHCPYCNENSHIVSSNVSLAFDYNKNLNHLHIVAFIGCSNPDCRKTTILHEDIHLLKKYDENGYDIAESIIAEYTKTGIEAYELADTGHCLLPYQDNPEILYQYEDVKDLIHPKIRKDFIEMQQIAQLSSTASVMLARRLLERIILDKWPQVITAQKWRFGFPSLEEMISWLEGYEEGEKRYTDANVMDSIRVIGNKTTHIYSSTEDIAISKSDADLIIAELDAIINDLYIIPGKRAMRKKNIESLAQRAEENSQLLKQGMIAEVKSGADNA